MRYDVGVDANDLAPVSLEEIRAWFEGVEFYGRARWWEWVNGTVILRWPRIAKRSASSWSRWIATMRPRRSLRRRRGVAPRRCGSSDSDASTTRSTGLHRGLRFECMGLQPQIRDCPSFEVERGNRFQCVNSAMLPIVMVGG